MVCYSQTPKMTLSKVIVKPPRFRWFMLPTPSERKLRDGLLLRC